jgi:hypothetical protein
LVGFGIGIVGGFGVAVAVGVGVVLGCTGVGT